MSIHAGAAFSTSQKKGTPCRYPRKSGGIADGREGAADVGHDEDEEHRVERGDAVAVHLDPRADQHHRGARRPDDVGEHRPHGQEHHVARGPRLAADADVQAGRHQEQRADQHHEGDVLLERPDHAGGAVRAPDEVVRPHQRAEPHRHRRIEALPPMPRTRRAERHDRDEEQEQGERPGEPQRTRRPTPPGRPSRLRERRRGTRCGRHGDASPAEHAGAAQIFTGAMRQISSAYCRIVRSLENLPM